MATIGKTLFAHFRQVLHASAQYDQARTVFHRSKKRLEVSNLCSLSWDQTVTFSDLAHGLLKVHCHAIQCFFVDLLRSKMAARRLEAAAPANEKQAFAAPRIDLQLSWSGDRARHTIFQVHLCIPLHSTIYTTIIDRQDTY